MQTGSITWFARHEWRLTWRDWRMLLAGQRRRRASLLIVLGLVAVLFLHLIAITVLHPDRSLAAAPDKHALIMVTAVIVMGWSLMLSQAVEAVARAFYARGDMELILTSPIAAWRLFAVRILAMVIIVALTVLVLAVPFINVLAWRGGIRWLAIYPATLAMAMLAVSIAIVLTAALFHAIGPARTRLMAQITSAVIGAVFAIGLQFGALLYIGQPDRLAFLETDLVLSWAPEPSSQLWDVALAMMGHGLPLLALVGVAGLALAGVIAVYAPRFGGIVLACASIGQGGSRRANHALAFHNTSPAQAFRRKELTLLRRDPWLVSQTLVQILYLLPAAYMLWLAFRDGIGGMTIVVPVLVTAAGQFAGGVAWLAISGEDAPDLIRTAPVRRQAVMRGTFEAVTGSTLIVFAPFLLLLGLMSPRAGLACIGGMLLAAMSATAIQYWYRLQAHRGRIRRRQTASKFTTYIEALVAISWAAAAALASVGLWLAAVPAIFGFVILILVWLISPSRGRATSPQPSPHSIRQPDRDGRPPA